MKAKKGSCVPKPLGPDFERTPGAPDVPNFPDPYGSLGPLTHRKRVLKPGDTEEIDDHGSTG